MEAHAPRPTLAPNAGGPAAIELSSAVIDFAGASPLGDLLRKIGYVRGLGCSLTRAGDGLTLIQAG